MDLIYPAPVECGGATTAANYNSTLQVLPEREPVEQQITYYVPDPPPPPSPPTTSTTSISGATSSSGYGCPDRVEFRSDGRVYVDGQQMPEGINGVSSCSSTYVTYPPAPSGSSSGDLYTVDSGYYSSY